jgi:hypothetical protein
MPDFRLNTFVSGFEKSPAIEVVIDAKTGRPRQAGATDAEGKAIQELRETAEKSLYVFAKGILGSNLLTTHLHAEVCDLAQRVPPYRKLFLLPRAHFKSTIFSYAMPIHILIQPRENNIYCPGIDGCNTRVLIANETATNAEHFLRVIAARFDGNKLLRSLWPHRVWENSRRDSKKWNEKELLLPRTEDYPEASIETIGVGGAITSRHYNILIKDDLISIEAANSPLVMQDAIQWHEASRALADDPDTTLEYIVGTRWAVSDLYQYILDNDKSVEPYIRAIVEDGQPILPERFSLLTISRLQREFGVMFPLLYMNSAVDPSLTDFDPEDLRYFDYDGTNIAFKESDLDIQLAKDKGAPLPNVDQLVRGQKLTRETYDMVFSRRHEQIRFRST